MPNECDWCERGDDLLIGTARGLPDYDDGDTYAVCPDHGPKVGRERGWL